MIVRGLDSGSPIPARAAAQAGFRVVFRYLYNLSSSEVTAHRDNGLSVSLIAEFDTQAGWHPVSQSPEAGAQHGAISSNQALALGAPAGTVIWATADTAVALTGYRAVATYLDGFRSGLGSYRPGIYGGARLCRDMVAQGHADAGWVAGADAWNDGVAPDRAGAVAHQLADQTTVGGVVCDLNDIFSPVDGFWFPALESGVQVGLARTDPPPKEEEPMGVYAYKLPNESTVWTTETRDGHLWYVPIAGPTDLADMLVCGAVSKVRALATAPKDGGNPEWDAPFTRAESAGRVLR